MLDHQPPSKPYRPLSLAMAENSPPPAMRAERWPHVRLLLGMAAIGFIALISLLPPAYALIALAAIVAVGLTLRWPVVGFCLLAFSVPWGSSFTVTLGSFPITSSDVLVAALGATWLAVAFSHRRSPVRLTPWLPFALLFLAALTLSSTQAIDTRASEREIVKWVEMLVVYLAATELLRGRSHVKLVVAAIVAAGVTQALLGYVQFAFQLGPEAFAHGSFLRAYGTFDQPNPYAGYLNIVLPFALAFGLQAPQAVERFAYRAALLLIFGAVLASESRGALLATVVAVTLILGYLFSGFRSLAFKGALAVTAGAWLATFGLVPLGPFTRVLDALGLGGVSFGNVTDANFSAVERAAHWLAGVRMFAAHPVLGVGIGNYAMAYPAYHPRSWYAPLAHAHNYYINIAAEAGIVGLTAYVLFIGSALWYSCAAIRRISDPLYTAALLGVLGALAATSFHNLFDVLYVHGLVALLGMIIALVPVSLSSVSRVAGEA